MTEEIRSFEKLDGINKIWEKETETSEGSHNILSRSGSARCPNRRCQLKESEVTNDVRYQEWTEMTLDCTKMFLESDRKQQSGVISLFREDFSPSVRRFLFGQKRRQPIGRPTYSAYHTSLSKSSAFVFRMCKSVYCTKTFCLFYIVLRLAIPVLLWYLIDTKRWYQCTGKSFRSWTFRQDRDDHFRE